MNTIFNENTYFDYFKNFNAALNRAAKADAIIKENEITNEILERRKGVCVYKCVFIYRRYEVLY